jgi:hypothetical protein
VERTEGAFGAYIVLSDGLTEATVTLDVGPRVISYRRADGENIFFEDVEGLFKKQTKAGEWRLYGGHRLWLAPEDDSTYFADNAPIRFETKDGYAIFYTSGRRMALKFLEDGALEVVHSYTNEDTAPIKAALWALTALKAGGALEIPLSRADTGYLPNRNIVYWSYSDIQDKRLLADNDKIVVKSDVRNAQPLKIGAYLRQNRTTYTLGNDTFVKTAQTAEGEYPDFGCNFEAYANGKFIEAETLSPLTVLQSGATITHTEKWYLKGE